MMTKIFTAINLIDKKDGYIYFKVRARLNLTVFYGSKRIFQTINSIVWEKSSEAASSCES